MDKKNAKDFNDIRNIMEKEKEMKKNQAKAKLLYSIKNTLDQYKPKDIVKYLDQFVMGQDEAKKYLSVAVYNHYKRLLSNNGIISNSTREYDNISIEKGNILICGNTGTGKTYMLKMIAQLLDVPYFIADATGMTAAGYVGNDVESMISGLLKAANHDEDRTELGICIIDEVDKIARKGENVSITRDVSGEDCQQGMLKILESTVVGVMPNGGRLNPTTNLTYIDTTNILFIGLGAFEGIERIIEKRMSKSSIGFKNPDKETINKKNDNILSNVTPADFRTFGMIPEFIGRFPIITHTNPLTKEDLVKILKEPKNNMVKQYKKLLDYDNVKLEFKDNAYEAIAEIALENKTGARGLRGVLEKILIDVMYEAENKKGKKIIITDKKINKFYKNYEIGKTA